MKNGHDHQDDSSNVVSLAGARKQAKDAARTKVRDRGERRTTMGQWLMSAFLVALAIGGGLALAAPLLRAAGIVGG